MVTRLVVGFLAVVLLLLGVAAGAVAVWAAIVLGPDKGLRFDAGRITPGQDARATIVDVERFEATVPYLDSFGDITMSVTTGEQGDPSDTLFLGAGDTEAVDAYLKSVPYSVALRDGTQWQVRDVPGSASAGLPRQQDFWLVQDLGRRPAIDVPDTRPLTVVIMHPSGIPSGPLTMSADFTVPDVGAWVRSMGIASGAFLLAGALLLYLALRRRGRRGGGRHAVGGSADEPVPASAPAAGPANGSVSEGGET